MQLSSWGAKMSGLSGIRSIMQDIALSAADGPGGDWLNLSPGNPARIPEVVETWRELERDALDSSFAEASCQYGPSRGSDSLVEAIVKYFNAKYNWSITAENVIVGPGCQMLCFIAATIFTGPSAAGRRQLIFPSVPEYTGYHGLCLEDGSIVGPEPEVRPEGDRSFRYAIEADALWDQTSAGMLLLSSPCNPTGRALETDELAALIRLAEKRDIPLVIDHAYGNPFPRVAGAATDPVLHPNVINCFTFSKAGLPGERLGFAIGPAQAIDAMVSFLANSMLHAPQLVQAVAARALTGGELDKLASDVIRPFYQEKRLAAEKLLHDRLPESVDWRLHSSAGGMFCWLWINESWFDDLQLYNALKSKKVFIVPGRHFFVGPPATPFLADHGTRCIRLSLSADDSVIGEGISRIAETLGEMGRARVRSRP
jgi:valine--pyruvate aminotransferase